MLAFVPPRIYPVSSAESHVQSIYIFPPRSFQEIDTACGVESAIARQALRGKCYGRVDKCHRTRLPDCLDPSVCTRQLTHNRAVICHITFKCFPPRIRSTLGQYKLQLKSLAMVTCTFHASWQTHGTAGTMAGSYVLKEAELILFVIARLTDEDEEPGLDSDLVLGSWIT